MIRKLLALATLLTLPTVAMATSGGVGITVQNGQVILQTPVTVANGGTGAATFTTHGVLVGEGTSAIVATATGTSGQALLSAGSGTDPSYGDLGVAHGGTGAVTLGAHGVLLGEGTSPIVSVTTCTSGQVLTCNSNGTADASFQAASTSILPILEVGSGMDITTSQTVFVSGIGVDLTEAVVQVPSPGATYKNLRCINSAIQGTSNNVVITGRVGACGSQANGSLTCTITGSASGNQSCNDTTNSLAPTTGQCFDFSITTPAALTANARVNCIVERTA